MNRKKEYVVIAIIILIIVLFIFIKKQVNQEDSENSNIIIESDNQQVSNFNLEVFVDNLETPWAIDFLSDGRMIITERSGKVSIIDNKQVEIIGEIDVSKVQESGLHGIAVDPDFKQNKYDKYDKY